MAQYVIRPLPILRLRHAKGMLTYLIDIETPIDTYACIWLIEGYSQRILVDAGGSAETMRRRGFFVEQIASPADALGDLGLRLDQIDLAICTHLHNDHMGLAGSYKNARFIIQKTELEANSNPYPYEASRCVPQQQLADVRFEIVEGDVQVVEGIKVIHTPGHTRGSQSVMIDTAKGKAIISGLCTLGDNFEPPEAISKVMPVILPGVHVDVQASFRSLLRIKAEADIIIPNHVTESALRDRIP